MKETASVPSVRSSIAWNLTTGPLVVVGNLALVAWGIAVAGASDYGAWALCFGAVSLMAQIDLGFGAALVRQLANLRASKRQLDELATKQYGLVLFGLLAIVFPFIYAWVLNTYFDRIPFDVPATMQAYMIGIGTIGLSACLMGRYFASVIQSYGQFYPERIATVIGLFVRAAIVLMAGQFGWGVYGVAASDLSAVLLVTAGTAAYSYRRKMLGHRMLPARGTGRVMRNLVTFSIPTFISSFATLLAIQVPLYFVGAMLGLSEAAAYSAITRVMQSGRTVFGWICGPWLPDASSEAGRGRSIASRHGACIVMIVLFAGVGCSLGLVFASEIMGAWLGSSFAAFGPALMIVCGALFLHAIYAPGVIFATAVGHPGIVAVNNVVVCCLTFGLCITMIAPFGTVGAAASVAVPVLVMFPISQYMTTRCTGLPYWRPLLFAFCVLVVDLGVCFGARSIAGPDILAAVVAALAVCILSAVGLLRFNGRLTAFVNARISPVSLEVVR